MINSILDITTVIIIITFCYQIGFIILNIAKIQINDSKEKIIFSIGLGLCASIILLTIFGFIGVLNAVIIKAIVFPIFILFILKTVKFRLKKFEIKISYNLILAAIIAIISFLYMATALAPTFDGDSLFGYLGIPREYFLYEKILPIDYFYGSNFPQFGQLITTLGFIMGGQIVGQLLITWAMGVLCMITLYCISIKIGCSSRAGLISIIIWYSSQSIAFLSQSAKIDLSWAFFDLLGLFAFMKWFLEKNIQNEKNWLFISGILFGIAFGIKHVSLFSICTLLIGISYKIIIDRKFNIYKTIKIYLTFLLPISISLIWIIRSYILTGSLLYSGSDLINNHGIFGFFKTIWQMSMLGNAVSYEGAMGKSIGPILLAILPLTFLYIKRNRNIPLILIFCLIMFLFWYNGVQRARHLLPMLGLLSIVSGLLIDYSIKEYKRFGNILLSLVLFVAAINMGPWLYINHISINRVGYIMSNNLNKHLEHNLAKLKWYPNYQMTTLIRDRLPNEIKIAALSTGNSYYLQKKFYGVRPTLGPSFTESVEDIEPNVFYGKLIDFGVTHVFLNKYFIDKYNLHSALLNDEKFQKKYLKKIMSSNGQILYELL